MLVFSTTGSLLVIASLVSIIVTRDVTKWHAVAAITVNLALGDFAYSGGFFPTLLDIAPKYAGLLSGVSTFVAFIAACPATLVNSIVVQQVRHETYIHLHIRIRIVSVGHVPSKFGISSVFCYFVVPIQQSVLGFFSFQFSY